jgi:MoxR-like ATPase
MLLLETLRAVFPDPFLVMATKNPIEQEGTYPLPEAHVGRFVLKLKVSYPDKSDEKIILERMTHSLPKINPVISLKNVQKAKKRKI